MSTACSTSGCRLQKANPSVRWPVARPSAAATKQPDAFVQNMDSCMVGLALGSEGLSALVDALTLSCSPPVTASISSDAPSSSRPNGWSGLPTFFFLPPKLKTETPSVMSATCRYSAKEYRFPPRTMPPAITGTILHDLPSTCVGKETYRSASFEAAIASICEMPELKISLCGILMPEPPSTAIPSSAMAALMPRSAVSARKVKANFSPLTLSEPPYSFL
mmetsp:Transcript_14681/g.43353  ORF Transcript_14681/g.43353 Transcript_14681/m.43353 type:complete len:220 (-) Transcript_14681:144-803(-)